MVFASPAALRGVAATAEHLSPPQRTALAGVRLLMSAGAPVPASLLRSLRAVLPAADAHTPYGMTEVLPVTDISLAGIEAAGAGEGVCVGRPLPGVGVRISPMLPDGRCDGELTDRPGVLGEVCVRAAHVKDRYDALWALEVTTSRNPGWHRTGDVGHLDADGRLWIEGRLQHVLTTAAGPVTPVGIEQRVEGLAGVSAAAVVGVGPAGAQVVAVVVVTLADATSGDRAGDRARARPRRRACPASPAGWSWPTWAWLTPSARPPVPTSPPCWSRRACRSTSGTSRRWTAARSPGGRRGCWPARGPPGREGPGHRGQRDARPGRRPPGCSRAATR